MDCNCIMAGMKKYLCLTLLAEYERNKIKEQITLGPHHNDSTSEVELSEESDSSVLHSNTGTFKMSAKHLDTPRQGWYEKLVRHQQTSLSKHVSSAFSLHCTLSKWFLA